MIPPSVVDSCTARPTIVLRTVSSSSVELTACPTSPSAVNSSTERVSSAVRSRNSLRSRAFSMAIAAWSANVSISAMWLSPNACTSCLWMVITPSSSPALTIGIAQGIFDVDGTTLQRCTPRRAAAFGHDRILLDIGCELRAAVVLGRGAQTFSVEAPDDAVLRPAESDRVLDQRFENRLEVERGAANDLEQIAGRRLLLQGLTELLITRLQLLEQAHVLDGDDRLIGEGLEERDLVVAERSNFEAADPDSGDRVACP